MIHVIINADDYGLNEKVNHCIEDAIIKKQISSTTIFANSCFLSHISEFSKAHSYCSFGVHLNLTNGLSLTRSNTLLEYGFIDEQGYFVKDFVLTHRAIKDSRLKSAIKEEWSAQIEQIKNAGILIDHIDGHHHCHSWIGLSDVLAQLLKKYDINQVRNRFSYPKTNFISGVKTRLAMKMYTSSFQDSILFGTNKLSNSMKETFQDLIFQKTLSDIKITDYFMSYEDFVLHQKFYIERQNVESVIELMCHPGLEKYTREYEMIQDDLLSINHSDTYKLVSYKQI